MKDILNKRNREKMKIKINMKVIIMMTIAVSFLLTGLNSCLANNLPYATTPRAPTFISDWSDTSSPWASDPMYPPIPESWEVMKIDPTSPSSSWTEGNAINYYGEIAGIEGHFEGEIEVREAFVYNRNELKTTQPRLDPESPFTCAGNGINVDCSVVGYSPVKPDGYLRYFNKACFWQDPTIDHADELLSPEDAPWPGPYFSRSQAWDINDRGMIVGEQFRWYSVMPTPRIKTTYDVVNTNPHIWYYDTSYGFQILETFSLPLLGDDDEIFERYGRAYAVNNRFEVVGFSENEEYVELAFYWKDSNSNMAYDEGEMRQLPSLKQGDANVAYDINNKGVIVGMSGKYDNGAGYQPSISFRYGTTNYQNINATIWIPYTRDDDVYPEERIYFRAENLNDRLSSSHSNINLCAATGINEEGWIVGYGVNTGDEEDISDNRMFAFLLSPGNQIIEFKDMISSDIIEGPWWFEGRLSGYPGDYYWSAAYVEDRRKYDINDRLEITGTGLYYIDYDPWHGIIAEKRAFILKPDYSP